MKPRSLARPVFRPRPLALNPDPMISFGSLRTARSFVRGYVCVERVVAVRRSRSGGAFVIVHPSTAKRHGWKVVA